MTLLTLLQNTATRIKTNETISQITGNWIESTLHIGFVTTDAVMQTGALHFDGEQVSIVNSVKDVVLVLQTTEAILTQLLSAERGTDVSGLLVKIRMLPHDEGAKLKRLLDALGLIADSDILSTRLPFALPLQYPVAENLIPTRTYQAQAIPEYDASKLPELICEAHPEWVEMYNYAWQEAFKHFRQPAPESGLVANFIDTAFNDNTFLWDSCFMMMFGRYCRPNFDFMGTLLNFYAKQHADGFICREINTYTGQDAFTPQDPRSTGPNIFAWTEWQDYQFTGDKERLKAVFPALLGYHNWWKTWRRWSNGGMWTSNLGSGMDNQTRIAEANWHHHNHVWIDATMQQALSCQMLLHIVNEINLHDFDRDLIEEEYDTLKDFINEKMWDESSHFYYDISLDGTMSTVKTIGAYWGVLAQVIPDERLHAMIGHLQNEQMFNRPHRVPSQAFDSVGYEESGRYWRGGVWSPTNYMVLKGLTSAGYAPLAHEIALNHVQNVAEVYQKTGTLWENYAPESTSEGMPAKANFVGWTGVSAITIPLEHLIGLRWIVPGEHLLWDIRLSGQHGVRRYPTQNDQSIDLVFMPRSEEGKPYVKIQTTQSFRLDIYYQGQTQQKMIHSGETFFELPV